MTDHFTLLISPVQPQRKTFWKDENGEIKKSDIHFPRYFGKRDLEVGSLRGMFDLIQTCLAKESSAQIAIMRGKFKDHAEIERFEGLRAAAVEAAEASGRSVTDDYPFFEAVEGRTRYRRLKTLVDDTARHWVCFDFDDFRPVGVTEPRFDVANPHIWVDSAIEQELGPEFAGRDYVLQLSSSAGLPKKKDLSAHVWFWMAEPMDSFDWKAWLAVRGAALGRKPRIDVGLFQAERVHYIAPPNFIKGASDPVSAVGGARFSYVEGFLGASAGLGGFEGLREQAENARFVESLKAPPSLVGDDSEEAKDAWTRPGVVGAWNRVFPMSDTINRFLSQHYRVDDEKGRVTWLMSPSGSVGSCRIVAGNTRMFSTSSGDPLEGYVGSAFDHVQAVLFGGDYEACADWARGIDEVRREMDRADTLDFDDVVEGVETKAVEVAGEGQDELMKAPSVVTAEIIAVEYPMPDGAFSVEQEYRYLHGAWWFGIVEADDDEEDSGKKGKKKKRKGGHFVKLWSPITVVGEETLEDTGDVSVRVRMLIEGGPIDAVIERESLAKSNDVLALLLSKGWRVSDPKCGFAFTSYLMSRNTAPSERFIQLRRPGWRDRGRGSSLVFACPSGEVISDKEDQQFVLADAATTKHAVKGSLEGWQEVAKAVPSAGLQHVTLGLAMAFAAPLLALRDEPGGMVYSAKSSLGKTTGARVAASAWGHPHEKSEKGTLHSLRNTAVALEAMAEKANGAFCGFDEVNMMPEAQKKTLTEILYSLAGGSGKARGNVNGDLNDKPKKEFGSFFLITMEQTLGGFIKQHTGQEPQPGLSVRFPSIAPDDQRNDVPQSYFDHLKDGFEANHGIAGGEFVRRLIAAGYAGPRLGELVNRQSAARFRIAGNVTGMEGRTANIFAWLSLAGELAVELGVLPIECAQPVQDAVRWAWGRLCGDEGFSTPEGNAIAFLREYCITHWDSGIVPKDAGRSGFQGALGFYDDQCVYFLQGAFDKATGGVLSGKAVAQELKRLGLLAKTERDGTLLWRTRAGGMREKYYVLHRAGVVEGGFGRPRSAEDFDNESGELTGEARILRLLQTLVATPEWEDAVLKAPKLREILDEALSEKGESIF